nr:basic salivary proline-rich protein 1-like [Taeniopygia guttata]
MPAAPPGRPPRPPPPAAASLPASPPPPPSSSSSSIAPLGPRVPTCGGGRPSPRAPLPSPRGAQRRPRARPRPRIARRAAAPPPPPHPAAGPARGGSPPAPPPRGPAGPGGGSERWGSQRRPPAPHGAPAAGHPAGHPAGLSVPRWGCCRSLRPAAKPPEPPEQVANSRTGDAFPPTPGSPGRVRSGGEAAAGPHHLPASPEAGEQRSATGCGLRTLLSTCCGSPGLENPSGTRLQPEKTSPRPSRRQITASPIAIRFLPGRG